MYIYMHGDVPTFPCNFPGLSSIRGHFAVSILDDDGNNLSVLLLSLVTVIYYIYFILVITFPNLCVRLGRPCLLPL